MNWETGLRNIMMHRGYSQDEIDLTVSKIRSNARAMSYVTCVVGIATTLTAVPRIAPLLAIDPPVAIILALGAGGWLLLSSPACAVVRADLMGKLNNLESAIDDLLKQNSSQPQ